MRLCFARNFSSFADSFGRDITDNNLIQTFAQLLNDNEAEVKHAAIQNISQCFSTLSHDKISSLILPNVTSNWTEGSPQFKAGAATALCSMAEVVGADTTNSKIVPILCDLIKDENSEVKLNVVRGLIQIAMVINTDLLKTPMIGQLNTLSVSAQWRVRM